MFRGGPRRYNPRQQQRGHAYVGCSTKRARAALTAECRGDCRTLRPQLHLCRRAPHRAAIAVRSTTLGHFVWLIAQAGKPAIRQRLMFYVGKPAGNARPTEETREVFLYGAGGRPTGREPLEGSAKNV